MEDAVTEAQNTFAQDMNPTRPNPVPAQGWSPLSIAQVSTTYGNVRSWLDGNTDVTITGHRWTNIQNGATTTITQRFGDAYAQDTTLWGNQHSVVHGGTNSHVDGHASSYIGGGQDSHIDSGQNVTITGGKTSTVVGVNFSGTAPLNISADVFKMSFGLQSLSIWATQVSLSLMHNSATVTSISNSAFYIANKGTDLTTTVCGVQLATLFSIL